MAAEPTTSDPDPDPDFGRELDRELDANAVVVDDVEIRRGGQVALSVPSLTLSRGVTCLVGPNGSGKSTLLHAIAGLLTPVRGTVRVGGLDPAAARRNVAYVLQSQHSSPFLPVSAREVVALGLAPVVGPFRRLNADHRARVSAAMERLEVGELADRHLTDMSGGQRQRVLVAQGLVQGAGVLLLDEPVAGLDIASIATIRRAIADERAAGRTVVVATHDLGEASSADAAVLMSGRVVACGNPSDVLSAANLRAAYHGRVLDLDGISIAFDDGAHHH